MKSKVLLKMCLAWLLMTFSVIQVSYAMWARMSPGNLSLKIGETKSVTVSYGDGYTDNFWYSIGPHVGYSGGGFEKTIYVTGASEGTSYVKCKIYRWVGATQDGTELTCNITVIADPPTKINLDRTSLDMQVNQTEQLTATVLPSTASQDVTWEVLEGGFNVASVNSSGYVTAKAPGEATIRVKAVANSSVYKDCKVKVYDWPTSVSLNKTNLNLELGDTTHLIATVLPEGAFPSVTWSKESGNNVITLGSDGLITAKAVGTINVMAQSTINSSAYANCTVTVTEPTLKPGVLSGNTLTIGDNATNSTSNLPYSNNYKYSTVQTLYTPTEIGKSGKIKSIAFKVVSAAAYSTSKVRVYLGHKSSIFSGTGSYVTSSNLTLVYSGTPILGHDVGWETLPFNQGYFTYNGTDNLVVVVTKEAPQYESTLKYQCYAGNSYTLYRRSDSSSENANISNTSISYTASTERPAVRLEFEGISPTGINLNSTNVNLRVGETKRLTATVLPSEASQSVTWSSDTPDVATVEDGKVTALSSGTAYIKATATDNPNISASCKVTVEDTSGTTGDVNGDGSVNGTDLVMLANIVLGKQAETTAADVNKDGSVNGTDIVALANIILGRASAPKKVKALAQSNGEANLFIEDFDIKAGETKEMIIDLSNPNDEFTLVQFDLLLPKGLSIKETGGELDIDMCDRTNWRKHSLDANKTEDYFRFLLYSSSNAVISGTKGGIIKVTLTADNDFKNGTVRINNILLVTPDQKETKPANYKYFIGTSSEDWQENSPLTIAKNFCISGGETEEMIIELTNPKDEITLVQFDLHLPNGLSIKETGGELDFDMCNRTSWRKHTLDVNKIDDFYRFLLYSSSNTIISGTEGGIIKVTIAADENFTEGTIYLDNILLVSPDQTEIKPTAYDFEVAIQDVKANIKDRNTPVIFNISGQRLKKLQHGVNIINGRKLLVK